ncbi:MAG: response regulator [Anaerolineae bacterium]|nr:response regulator [Anaerolineae bacterium]
MNWLIAEDEADIRNLVGIMCTVWGHVPLAFESGQKVWDWLDQVEAGTVGTGLPVFALMDIRMPGRRGSELAQRIRSIDKLKDIPIVLMTAFVLGDDEIDHLKQEYGVDHVINKPLPDFDRLGIVLHDLIKQKHDSVKAAADSFSSTPGPILNPSADVTAPAPSTDTLDENKSVPSDRTS